MLRSKEQRLGTASLEAGAGALGWIERLRCSMRRAARMFQPEAGRRAESPCLCSLDRARRLVALVSRIADP